MVQRKVKLAPEREKIHSGDNNELSKSGRDSRDMDNNSSDWK